MSTTKMTSLPIVVARAASGTFGSFPTLPRKARAALAPYWVAAFLLALVASPAKAGDPTAQPVSPAALVTTAPERDPAAERAIAKPDEARADDETPKNDEPKATTAVNAAVGERLLLANNYLEKGRPDDALSVVDELASMRKLKPVDRAQIHRFRGYILTAKGNLEGAGEEFEAALSEHALEESASQPMIYSLAQIYTQAGKYIRARELIDRWFATATDPKPEAYFLKAMVLVQQEDYHGALEPARTAIERNPEPRESWLQLLTAIQFQLQDYAGVADTLRKLIAVSPSTKRYWIQLATIENTIGRDESAMATLGVAQLAGMLTEDREYRQRARQCFVHDLPECCAKTLEDGMAAGIVKADADSWQLLANCQIASRETDKALGPLAKAGELSTDGKGYLLLGQLQLQKEQFVPARDALGKALKKAKPEERASIELLIGIAELGSERFDDAERSFKLAAADEKTRPAAESYLKHLEQKRALRDLKNPAATDAQDDTGTSAPAPRT